MIVLVAALTAQPGKEADLEAELRTLVAASRDEPGTLTYAVHRHRKDARRFLVYERYVDRDGLRAHGESAALKRFAGRLSGLGAGPAEVATYELLDER